VEKKFAENTDAKCKDTTIVFKNIHVENAMNDMGAKTGVVSSIPILHLEIPNTPIANLVGEAVTLHFSPLTNFLNTRCSLKRKEHKKRILIN
jgi:hypothetical protein